MERDIAMRQIEAAAFRAAREERSAEVWRRFAAACMARGLEPPPDPGNARGRCAIVQRWRHVHGLRLAFGSILEAADAGYDGAFLGRPPAEPCGAAPGSAERIRCYAARLERGEDLWGDADFSWED